MSLPVYVEPEAQAELREAARWYEARRDGLGVELILEVDRTYQNVAARPQSYPLVPGAADVRRALVDRFPYAVVYMVQRSLVIVIAVAHGKRRPLYWAGRKQR